MTPEMELSIRNIFNSDSEQTEYWFKHQPRTTIFRVTLMLLGYNLRGVRNILKKQGYKNWDDVEEHFACHGPFVIEPLLGAYFTKKEHNEIQMLLFEIKKNLKKKGIPV